VNFTLELGEGISVLQDNLTAKYQIQANNLTLYTGFYLPPGSPLSVYVPLNFTSLNTSTATERLFVANAVGAMDLTVTPGEDEVSEVLDQPLEFPLVITFANLSGDPSGYTVHLNLTTDANDLGIPLRYIWWRRNINFGNENGTEGEWYIISNSTLTAVTDKVSGHSSPQVDYMVSLAPIDSSSIVAQSNLYHFAPKPSRWWLPLVIALPIAVAVLGLLIGAVVWSRKKHPEWYAANPDKKPKPRPVPSSSSFSNMDGSPKSIAEDAAVDPKNAAKQYTVNIDYLMTGARRVVVKDGNPTSTKPPEDYDPEAEGNNGKKGELDVDEPRKLPWYRRIFKCF